MKGHRRYKEKQKGMAAPVEPKTPPELDSKLKEIYKMTDTELKITTVMKLNEMQGNTDRLKNE